MTSITIRDVPEATRAALAARAARSGRSMQEYLRLQLTELVRQPDPEELMEVIRARKHRIGTTVSAEAILQARDADRR